MKSYYPMQATGVSDRKEPTLFLIYLTSIRLKACGLFLPYWRIVGVPFAEFIGGVFYNYHFDWLTLLP